MNPFNKSREQKFCTSHQYHLFLYDNLDGSQWISMSEILIMNGLGEFLGMVEYKYYINSYISMVIFVKK